MPLVEKTPNAPPTAAPVAIRITDPQYKGVTVDTRYIPTSHLLTAIEGSSWKVNYYSQVVDTDNDLSGQLVNREAILQQYRLVIGFEFKVTTALTDSQDDQSKAMIVSGAANIYPFLVPNVGDMFLADIGDGREGVFKITSSERRSIFKDTSHFVEYELIDYSTEERRIDLNRKVVKTLYFLRDFLYYGQNPLIEEEQYRLVKDLAGYYFSILDQWSKRYFSNEYQTFILPGQGPGNPVYDHFLIKAVKACFGTNESLNLQFVRQLNVADDPALNAMTIWDGVIQQDPNLAFHWIERAGVVPATTFSEEPMEEGIRHSGIRYVVYPLDPQVSIDYEITTLKKVGDASIVVDVPSRDARIRDLLFEPLLDGLPYGETPLINPVKQDDNYIFSAAFYAKAETGQSKFELAVQDHIKRQPIDPKLLTRFCTTYHAWGGLERFYFTPMLLLMIKSVIRGI